jgi:hypothetical protein
MRTFFLADTLPEAKRLNAATVIISMPRFVLGHPQRLGAWEEQDSPTTIQDATQPKRNMQTLQTV